MIAIVSDGKSEQTGKLLFEYFKDRNVEVEFISADNRDVKPCYGCGGCTCKTFGKCVIRDDMDEIMPILVRAEVLVFMTELFWGSFSYEVKRILDKIALMGDRFYHVKDKEIYKGIIGKAKKVAGIAVSGNPSEAADLNFRNLLREMGTIMGIAHMGKVISEDVDKEEIARLGEEVLR